MKAKDPIMNPDDQLRLVKCAPSDFERRLIAVLRYFGMHVDVVVHPKKHDVKVELGWLSWRRGKTKRRTRWIVPDGYKWLDEFFRTRRRYRRQTYNNWLREVGEEAGLDGVAPNTLRHTCGWNLVLKDFSVAEIANKLACTVEIASEYYLLVNKELSSSERAQYKERIHVVDAEIARLVEGAE